MANFRKSERSEGRRKRVPVGGGLQLKTQLSAEDRKLFEDRGKVPYWFNDDPGRIERAQAGGYDFVSPEHARSLGQGALHADGDDPESGARVSLVVSRGDPIVRSYLMEIDKEFYEEDQVAKEGRNAAIDEALKGGNAGGADIENKYGEGVTYSH